MTQQDAQAIYDNFKNKAGRRPADYYTAKEILGIAPTTTEKKSTPRQQTTKDNFILKNDDVNENEKFRYVRIKQIQQMNSTNMTPQAHHLLLALMTSPNSNSLGAYKISISEMSAQTGGQSREVIIKALNDLISLGEVRYIDGVIYLNKFLTNQKQHGNKDNLIGIIKNYNSLQDTAKLPYKGSINYQGMTMTQLVEEFQSLMKGISMMGLVGSGAGININEYSDIYTQEQIKEIIEENKHSFADTSTNVLKSVAPAFIVPDVEEEQVEEETTPITETIQQDEIKQEIIPVVTQQPQQEELRVISPVIQQQEITQPPKKLSEEEIEKIIYDVCDIKEDKKEVFKKVLKHELFNNLYLFVRNGGKNPEKIKELFMSALFEYKHQGNSVTIKKSA